VDFCPAGHELARDQVHRACPACRREAVVTQVAAADSSLPREVIAAAVAGPAALRSVAAALAADPGALAAGAPPSVGRLVTELIARGSATLRVPACIACGREGRQLTRASQSAMCAPCAHRAGAAECARCHAVKPAAGRTSDGQPICERCRRHERGHRLCGICGKTASIAARARGDSPDVCVNCYKMPDAICSVCGRQRECNFAGGEQAGSASERRMTVRCHGRSRTR